MTDIRFFGKRSPAIAAMNVELPPFKDGDYNPESASTLDRDITSLDTDDFTESIFENMSK